MQAALYRSKDEWSAIPSIALTTAEGKQCNTDVAPAGTKSSLFLQFTGEITHACTREEESGLADYFNILSLHHHLFFFFIRQKFIIQQICHELFTSCSLSLFLIVKMPKKVSIAHQSSFQFRLNDSIEQSCYSHQLPFVTWRKEKVTDWLWGKFLYILPSLSKGALGVETTKLVSIWGISKK